MRRRGWVPGRSATPPGEAPGRGRAAQWRISALRRAAAALAAGLAVWWIVDASLAVGAPAQHRVLVAARDLTTGTILASGDLREVPWHGESVPETLLAAPHEAVGQVLNGPLRAEEPLTRTRLGAGSLVQGFAEDTVVVQLPRSGIGGVSLVRAGDRIDVLSTADGAVVAKNVQVLAVTGGDAQDLGLSDPGGSGADFGADGVVLACGPVTAQRLVRASASPGGGPALMLTVRAPRSP